MDSGTKKRRDSLAMYAKIALDIANRIANGEIEEGRRLSGRSLMASEYGVSPETIRRAFSLLEEIKAVEVLQNSGVVVKSKERALEYIKRHTDRDEVRAMLSRMHQLIEQNNKIERELFDITKTLIDSSERFAASNPFHTYEITVKKNSKAINKNLSELNFWHNTGATVIAIRREGSIILSPGPNLLLAENDDLVVVGNQHTREQVDNLLNSN
ncbi:MAG: TrkA C-terminal domain-containing protein [Sphaerochaetaceae bacterium]|jgi:K+/H+ antiporter YhaU regulatory subunit KhtT